MTINRNWLLVLITCFVFFGLLTRYLDRVPPRHYCDYRVYYKAGQDFIKAKDIYFRETKEITPFKYSPFFAFVFAPLSLLPIKASASFFFAINFFLTILFFKLVFDFIQGSGIFPVLSDKERILVYVLALLCSLRYIFLVWDSGQVNIVMCVLVMLALTFLSKDKALWAGAFFAASILIKYTPAIFLPYILIQKKFKAVFWTTLFVALFLFLPALVVGLEKEMFYISSWVPSIIATSLDHFSYLDSKNQSIFSMVLRIVLTPQYTSQDFDRVLFYGHLAALLLYLGIFIPGKSSQRDMPVDAALLMICMSLFNPNGWLLNFVSLILSYMLLVQQMVATKGKDRFILFSLIGAFIITNFMSRDLFGKSSEDFGCFYSFTTIGSLMLYTALLKLKFSAPDILKISSDKEY